jgi:ubiquitin-conjugating enzyme E2 D/E
MSSSPSAKSEQRKRKAEDVSEEAGDDVGGMDADAKKAEEKTKKAEEKKKKKKKAKSPGLDQCKRRVQKELAEISLDPPANISAGPKGDSLCEWVRSGCLCLHSPACPGDPCLHVAVLGCPDYGS